MEWQDEIDDDELRDATRKYLPETVVWTTDWTTGALIDQITRNIFDVDPPFQRRNAWDDKKASLYIESLLLGCPVPPITLAEVPVNARSSRQYLVIDGKQRLGSLKRFVIDGDLRLTGLETLPQFNGAKYFEVSGAPEFGRFANLPIRTIVMRNWKKDEVLQFVFHRLNTQVTPLSTHELRRSLLSGPFTNFLDEASARSRGIQRILNIDEPDYRLRDAELLLRAVALVSFFTKYRGNLKQFLDTGTRSLNRSWSLNLKQQLEDICTEIDAAIACTYAVFGEAAFQRYEEGYATGRFNRAIFDVMVLTLRFEDVRLASVERKGEVVEALNGLMVNPDFNRWTQATTKSREAVVGRLSLWSDALSRVIGIPSLVVRAQTPALDVD
ncbi:DUF262 domain-containing protein [Nocardioides islandensis]|uniref:DUF262 domain-containing protein n=1 Tax=Nocardioides islandensis TaxID=433663 RepID=A0A930YDW2_9ACTN|nr:DUF262 domain-containing protein [Nocardioides islandensis]MBF4764696.1 DUF262 domain-containing protein [Nocardioides islandensis]